MKIKFFEDHLIRRIVKNSGVVFFGNSTASALSIVSFTIMAKQLGPESLAFLALSQTYALILNDIFNVQTWESMVKFGSRDLKDRSIANVIKTNVVLDFGSAIAAFAFALLLAQPVVRIVGWDESFVNLVSLYSLSILFNITTFTIGIPRLFDRFTTIAKIQVVTAFLKLLCVLYAMYLSGTLIYYLSIYLFFDILTNLIIIIFSVGLLKNKLGKNWWSNKMTIDKEHIKFIWWTNLRTIIRIPVRHFDMIVISSVMSIKMVGVYKVYKEIAGILNRVSEPLNQTIYPEYTKLIGSNKISEAIDVTKKTMKLFFGVSFLITISLILVSSFLIETFFGVEYLAEINAMYVLISAIGLGIVLTPINSLFIAAGFAKYSVYLVLLTNSSYLFAAFTLGKLFGIYGVIFAWIIQAILNQGLKMILLKKYRTGWNTVIR